MNSNMTPAELQSQPSPLPQPQLLPLSSESNNLQLHLNESSGNTLSKTPNILIALLCLTILQSSLAIAALVLKGTSGYIGFDGVQNFLLEASCGDNYLKLKYNLNQVTILSILIVIAGTIVLLSLILLIISIVTICRVKSINGSFGKVFPPILRSFCFILQSLSTLCCVILCGYYVSFYVDYMKSVCGIELNDNIILNFMVIWILCAVTFVVCWINWGVVVGICFKGRIEYGSAKSEENDKKGSQTYEHINKTEITITNENIFTKTVEDYYDNKYISPSRNMHNLEEVKEIEEQSIQKEREPTPSINVLQPNHYISNTSHVSGSGKGEIEGKSMRESEYKNSYRREENYGNQQSHRNHEVALNSKYKYHSADPHIQEPNISSSRKEQYVSPSSFGNSFIAMNGPSRYYNGYESNAIQENSHRGHHHNNSMQEEQMNNDSIRMEKIKLETVGNGKAWNGDSYYNSREQESKQSGGFIGYGNQYGEDNRRNDGSAYQSKKLENLPGDDEEYMKEMSRYRREQSNNSNSPPKKILPERNSQDGGSETFKSKPKSFKEEGKESRKREGEGSRKRGILSDYIRGKYID